MEPASLHPDHQSAEKQLNLSASNMSEFGYARFCYVEEKEKILRLGFRMIDLGRHADGSPEFLKILIPEKYLYLLSRERDRKLNRLADFYLEGVGDEIDHLKILSKRAGWNQTEKDLEILIQMAKHSYYLAKIKTNEKNIPLGSGALVNLGENISWISMILVHAEVRRQGIAACLLYHCLQKARTKGKSRIVGLDATPGGKKLYDLLGFEKSFSIRRCKVPVHISYPNSPGISLEPFFRYDSISDFLYQRGFKGRDNVFRSLLKVSKGGCFIARSKKAVAGLVMSRPGALKPYVGPLIADNEEVAAMLLGKALLHWKDQGIDQVLIDVPSTKLKKLSSENKDGSSKGDIPVLVEDGFLKGSYVLRKFDRMYHLVSEKNQESIFNFLKNDFSKEDKIANMLDESEKSYGNTMAYVEKEKNELLRYQYAIGGPEFS
jgi:GNAT superfamily N-acetyltransferase